MQEIKEEANHRFENDMDIADLQSEHSRYLKLKNGLPEIIDNLKGRLTIDISDGKFEEGIRRVIVRYLLHLTKSRQVAFVSPVSP